MAEPVAPPNSIFDFITQHLGWVTAAVGFLFTSGKFHQRFTQVEEVVTDHHTEVKEEFRIRDDKHDKLVGVHSEMRDLLIELRTDVKHIREAQNRPHQN